MVDLPEGGFEIYKGLKGQMRLVQWTNADHDMYFYEGAKGHEQLKTLKLADGYELKFEVWEGEERMVSRADPSGEVEFYDKAGPYDAHGTGALKLTVYPDGERTFFDGPVGEEYYLLVLDPHGRAHYYDGPKGEERKIRIEFPTGVVWDRGQILWHEARCWTKARSVAMYWLKCKEERVCAPGGAGRQTDLKAFEADFRS